MLWRKIDESQTFCTIVYLLFRIYGGCCFTDQLIQYFNYAILFVGGLYYWVYHINDPVSSHDDQEKQIVPRVDLLKGASDDWQCSLSTKKVKKMVHSLSYLSDTYLWLVVVY